MEKLGHSFTSSKTINQTTLQWGNLIIFIIFEIVTSDTWMDLENITASEISQAHNDKYCMILLMSGTLNRQIHRDRKKIQDDQWMEKETNGG